jgi:hypothetical protein
VNSDSWSYQQTTIQVYLKLPENAVECFYVGSGQLIAKTITSKDSIVVKNI